MLPRCTRLFEVRRKADLITRLLSSQFLIKSYHRDPIEFTGTASKSGPFVDAGC
jgi:hypothetical protein